ncbi:CFI-box-CTERM domain-containing protein [Geotalea toluenoxydans]|uniref:CFI-box-CTERM domain-containing protein n=1 Tax=Geotalea toluenoxydans TaxID=421624 RepID=UPI000A8BFC4A|nr:CFI-box-CTERM domain-containing protein [Geotalea toluenoxydans]
MRQIWEQLATQSSPGGGANIPMLPVIDTVLRAKGSSLDNDFFSFSKKLYLRDWTSHTNDIALIHPVVPKQAFSAYPVSSGTSPGLPHYSFAFYKFVKSATAPQDLVLRLSQSQGINVAAFRKNTSGSIDQFSQAADGTITIPSFNAAGTEEVMLLICNASSSDNLMAYFNTDGSTLPPVSGGTTTASGGGKSGCFIATAAYGSYLHPKVAMLRQFRDHYLLTNAPGRAFVSLYYRVSPPLAAFIAEHATTRTLCRAALTPIVFFVEHTAMLPLFLTAMGGILLARRSRKHFAV